MNCRNIIEFDNDNFNQILHGFAGYRKCFGLLTANMCHLPIVKYGFIVIDAIDEIVCPYLRGKYGDTIMCRTDAPFNAWRSIPRGRDIKINDLQDHYIKMRNAITSKIVMLCFQHPSVYFTGKFVDRWAISGAANILIIWGKEIVIEYVGRGFDVGDLTRGVNLPHQRFSVPWTVRNMDYYTIWDKMNIDTITVDAYNGSRESRIGVMKNMGYEYLEVVSNIPTVFSLLEFNKFRVLYQNCIKPVLHKRKLFLEDEIITILVNIYKNAFHVFEIWDSYN
ncbi:MAG: hypothetical protein LBD29_07045 [Treponema sp.]|jgi:hypothetical protein|nr:hypothetical protein [Treponema sp.]